MAKYYSHYWARSKHVDWHRCEFTSIQSRSYPSMNFLEGIGYKEENANKLVEYWNAGGRAMGEEMGYEYSLTPPLHVVE